MEDNMSKYRWFAILGLIAVCAIAVSGCRPKKASNGLRLEDTIIGEDIIIADDFPPRPDEGTMEILTTVVFAAPLFDYDSTQIIESERAKVDVAVEYIKTNPQISVVIEGHCDERGSADYNMALGERRALAVRAYMIGLGVDPARMQTKSYGKEKPAALEHDESAWRINRRAEFVFFNE